MIQINSTNGDRPIADDCARGSNAADRGERARKDRPLKKDYDAGQIGEIRDLDIFD